MKTLTVGQLAACVGISVEAVRFYEREGLVDEASRGTSSGYREFPSSAVNRLIFIQRAKQLGFTLKEIKKLLSVWLEFDATHDLMCGLIDDKVADLDALARDLLEKSHTLKQLCADCRKNALAQECPVMKALAEKGFEVEESTFGVPSPTRCRSNHEASPNGQDSQGKPQSSGG